ncbi:MAG: cyanuric acid amidohydrolase [Acidimicrobiaceae bacterium]|nr:cyanuric acid amidohydrolase [Acidimicrobiaceae bacterium]
MRMQQVRVDVCEMASPSDMSSFVELLDHGGVNAEDVIAIVGKTEGGALVDDYNRELSDLRFREVVAERMGISRDGVAERIAIVLSGGTFGVLAPHVTVISRTFQDVDEVETSEKRLVVGRAFSEPILPEEIGRMPQIRKVAAAVRTAFEESQVADPTDVHSVQVKAPTITREMIAEAASRGRDVVTLDLGTTGAFGYANDASALGVALALGEVEEAALSDDVVRTNWNLFSSVAATSAAPDKIRAEVLLLGNAAASTSDLRIGHGITRDFIDTSGTKEALRSAGLEFSCCPSDADLERVVQVFAKLIIPDGGMVRGHRTTLLDDIESAKTTKALGGALIGSVVGRTAFYMSGGEMNSHQGPPGGSPVAVIVRA